QRLRAIKAVEYHAVGGWLCGHHTLSPRRAAICFSRLLCTEEGMRSASRYLATVRRAISMPSRLSCSTILSSESTALAGSASMSSRMRWRTASEECASSPSDEAMEEVKKYLSSNTPREVVMYLLEVTR